MRWRELAERTAELLKSAAVRWGDEIPTTVLAQLSSACLAIADDRLEVAERLLMEIGERMQ